MQNLHRRAPSTHAHAGWYWQKKHWLANNVLGAAFSLQGIEQLSLGATQNGVILLCGEWEGGRKASVGRPVALAGGPQACNGLARMQSSWEAHTPLYSCMDINCSVVAAVPLPPAARRSPPPHPPSPNRTAGLFLYDIFWVFYTPVMVSVAKNFDAPIKLLFPRGMEAGDARASPACKSPLEVCFNSVRTGWRVG